MMHTLIVAPTTVTVADRENYDDAIITATARAIAGMVNVDGAEIVTYAPLTNAEQVDIERGNMRVILGSTGPGEYTLGRRALTDADVAASPEISMWTLSIIVDDENVRDYVSPYVATAPTADVWAWARPIIERAFAA